MQIFSELMDQLPAKKEEVEQLDKASVMRLAISYLRARDVVSLREYPYKFYVTIISYLISGMQ